MPFADLTALLLVSLLALLVAGVLAPLETLGWWAGWYGRSSDEEALAPRAPPGPRRERFLVFLTGIHSVSDQAYAKREIALLKRLEARLPGVEIVQVFPYSVTNRALTGQRVFAWFWRWLLNRKLDERMLAGITGLLINLRNLWQVAVSADRRYGPLYNQGSADLIVATLLEHGYDPAHPAPITLIGYSGGAQIAAGAVPHLEERLGTAVEVISLGGVVSADPGLDAVARFFHLVGRNDRVQRYGVMLFPGRWRILPHSSWNRGLQRGHIRVVDMGAVNHTGRGGYLDAEATTGDGRSNLDHTVETIAAIVEGGDSGQGRGDRVG